MILRKRKGSQILLENLKTQDTASTKLIQHVNQFNQILIEYFKVLVNLKVSLTAYTRTYSGWPQTGRKKKYLVLPPRGRDFEF